VGDVFSESCGAKRDCTVSNDCLPHNTAQLCVSPRDEIGSSVVNLDKVRAGLRKRFYKIETRVLQAPSQHVLCALNKTTIEYKYTSSC
jgi:hypothetical protein